LGITLLNSSYCLLSSDPLEILGNFGLTDYFIGPTTDQLTYFPDLTYIGPSTTDLTTSSKTHVQSKNGDLGTITPSTRGVCLPKWVSKTIEVVRDDAGDINDSRKTRIREQYGSISLMACVL
jgi:hypothetical protein